MTSNFEETRDPNPLALFCAVGIELPAQSSPSIAERIKPYLQWRGPKRPLLLTGSAVEVEASFNQLPLLLDLPSLPPARRADWLDYGVYDVFRDIECAQVPALALEAAGFRHIWRLLELSEGRLARSPYMTQAALNAMKFRLQSAGLQLGRRVGHSHAIPTGKARATRMTVVR